MPPPLASKRSHDAKVDHDSILWSLDASDAQLHRMRAYYMANVEMIDTQVGEILDSLQSRGYLEDAIVVFTTDHGDCLGDHGLSQKWCMYKEVVRVPLIVSAPGRFTGGRQVDAMV